MDVRTTNITTKVKIPSYYRESMQTKPLDELIYNTKTNKRKCFPRYMYEYFRNLQELFIQLLFYFVKFRPAVKLTKISG